MDRPQLSCEKSSFHCLPGEELVADDVVVDQKVGGLSGDIGQDIAGGTSDQVILHLLRGQSTSVEGRGILGENGKVVGDQTSNVGGGHGGTGDGASGIVASDPGRENVLAGAKDVNTRAVVGEVGAGVVQGRGTDSDGGLNTSGRVVASIAVVVTGSNGKVEARGNSVGNGSVKRTRLATTQGHVGNRSLVLLALLSLELQVAGDSKVNTSNDIGHGTRSVGAKDLHGDNLGLLGNTKGGRSNCTGAVSAVAVVILIWVARGDGLAPGGSASELLVVDVNTSVDNKDGDTIASVRVVLVLVEGAEGQSLAVGDTGQTPGSVSLSFGGIDDLVALDIVDLEDIEGRCLVRQGT